MAPTAAAAIDRDGDLGSVQVQLPGSGGAGEPLLNACCPAQSEPCLAQTGICFLRRSSMHAVAAQMRLATWPSRIARRRPELTRQLGTSRRTCAARLGSSRAISGAARRVKRATPKPRTLMQCARRQGFNVVGGDPRVRSTARGTFCSCASWFASLPFVTTNEATQSPFHARVIDCGLPSCVGAGRPVHTRRTSRSRLLFALRHRARARASQQHRRRPCILQCRNRSRAAHSPARST